MTHRPRVTAGLTWQPEMEPMAYAATSSERPKASATPRMPTDPLGKKVPVARMAVPAPPTTRIIVPMASAIPVLRRLSTAFPFDRQFSIGSCGQIAPARVAGLLLAENTRHPGGGRRGPCAAMVATPAAYGPPDAHGAPPVSAQLAGTPEWEIEDPGGTMGRCVDTSHPAASGCT